jgi:hypothetical protein
MTRIRNARMTYRGWAGSPARAAEIARRALALLPAQTGATGRLGRVVVTVQVGAGTSDRAIAERVAAAVGRRLDGSETE